MLSQGLANPKPGHLISGRRFAFALREPDPSQISFCLNRIYQYQYLLILMLMLLVSQDFQRPEDLSLSIFINIVKSLLILRFSLFRRGKAVLFLCSLMRNDKCPSQADRIIRLQPPFLRSPRIARIAVRVLFVPEDRFQQTLPFPDGGVARVFARRSSSFAPTGMKLSSQLLCPRAAASGAGLISLHSGELMSGFVPLLPAVCLSRLTDISISKSLPQSLFG